MSPRLRRSAALLVFALSVVALAATSPPPPVTVKLGSERATLHLDPEHPASLSRIVVKVNAEATALDNAVEVSLSILGGGGSTVRLIVFEAAQGSEAPNRAPSAWQAEAQFGSPLALPITCGVGSCERAFWLVAQLMDPPVARDVEWEVTGRVRYLGNAWPSGAAGSIALDPPILIASPVPQLGTSTKAEDLALGPTRPAAARIVEVRIGGDAIPADGTRIGRMSVDLAPRPGSGGSSDRPPIVHIYPLRGSETEPAVGPGAEPAGDDTDPFEGCTPGVECVRWFLVTFAWSGAEGADELYDWSFSVERTDVVRMWSTPAELTATVVRKFETVPATKPAAVRFEGDQLGVVADAPPQFKIRLGATATTDDPFTFLLPIPAVMTYRVRTLTAPAASTEGPVRTVISTDGRDGIQQIAVEIGSVETVIVANPLAGCRINGICPDLTIETVRGFYRGSVPQVPIDVRWSFDLLTYSWEEIPVELSFDRLR